MNTNPRFSVPDPDPARKVGAPDTKPLFLKYKSDAGPLKDLLARLVKDAGIEIDPDDMQRLIDRFAKAKWTTGLNIDSPAFTCLTFSPLGQERMTQLAEACRLVAPHLFGGGRQKMNLANLIRYAVRRFLIIRELRPPRLSKGEHETLLGLSVFYSLQYPKP